MSVPNSRSSMADAPAAYVVIVPVKPPAHGKSRLAELGDRERRDLAAAFAHDTLVACLAAAHVARVLVVSDDPDTTAHALALGCATTTDDGAVGLNSVLGRALGYAHDRWPELVPVALCSDLPALLPSDLDAALGALPAGAAAYVEDADGTGTVLYSAPFDRFEPAFGPASSAAHLAGGAAPVPGALASLRRDVDDLAGLQAAILLGVGPATGLAVARLEPPA